MTTITNIEASNSLADLAARVRQEHDAVGDAMSRGAAHAMHAGDMLIEAKAQLKHGQWLPWLRDHCRFSERTAQQYMQVARNRDVVETKLAADANLTITGVVKLLASPGSGAPGDVDEALDAIPSEVPPFAVLAVGKLLPEPEAST